MIIATVTAIMILFNGHAGTFSFDIFASGVQESITDKKRVKQIEQILKEADDLVKAENKKLKKTSKKLLKLTAAYTTTRKELSEFQARVEQQETAFERRMIQQRMKFTDLVTEDEWNAIYAHIRIGQKSN